RLGGLAAVLAAERLEPLPVAAVDDHALDPRQRLPDAGDLRGGLPAAADHPEARRAGTREVARRDAGGRAGAQLPELVGLDHRLEAGLGQLEEEHGEDRAAVGPDVRLEARVAELRV